MKRNAYTPPSPEEIERLRDLEPWLKERIIGQDHVIEKIVPRLQAGKLGITDPARPMSSFLFLGPTGVGKTETALAFTEYLFGKEKLVRIDMSEYQHISSIERLLGRHGRESGILSQRMEQTGNSGTLLLDEIEKAHSNILDLLLQILDCGKITNANGLEIDLSGFFVVMTSNIASEAILKIRQSAQAAAERFVQNEARKFLRPEIFARIEQVLVYKEIDYSHREKIASNMIEKETERLRELGLKVVDAEGKVSVKNYQSTMGLRSLRNAVTENVQRQIADQILKIHSQ